jgi:ribonuclease Z
MRRIDSRSDVSGVVGRASGAANGLRRYSARYHTTTPQLAELANRAKPKLLVLYHYSSQTPEGLNAEMRSLYAGHFIVSRDLDVY